MRRRLIKNLLERPVTEAAPASVEFEALGERLRGASARELGTSLAIREVNAGSCNGCELEIHALNNAYYDLERFGVRFTASPRHADSLLVTGFVTHNICEALERTDAATPAPKMARRRRRLRGRLRQGSHALRRRRLEGRSRRSRDRRLHADADRSLARVFVFARGTRPRRAMTGGGTRASPELDPSAPGRFYSISP